MRINIVAVGTKMPGWVQQACEEYRKRLPREWHFKLIEIPLAARGKNQPSATIIKKESDQLLAAIPLRTVCIALDNRGAMWDTPALAQQLHQWQQQGQEISLLVGGPDGLSPQTLQQAHQVWSLSPLTFPHALVRVILLEQLYRAWTLLTGHPYHRP